MFYQFLLEEDKGTTDGVHQGLGAEGEAISPPVEENILNFGRKKAPTRQNKA